MVLVLPTHVFGEAIIKLQKFITYSYNIQIIHILVRWNPLENGNKIHKKFITLIIVNSASSKKSLF
jgi:hypothetical protein